MNLSSRVDAERCRFCRSPVPRCGRSWWFVAGWGWKIRQKLGFPLVRVIWWLLCWKIPETHGFSQNRCTSINKVFRGGCPVVLVSNGKPEQNTPCEKDTDICGVVSDMSAKHAGIVNSGVFFHSNSFNYCTSSFQSGEAKTLVFAILAVKHFNPNAVLNEDQPLQNRHF